MGAANCIPIKIEKNKFRALVDTGAEISVIKSTVLESLREKPEIKKIEMNLRTANGSPLIVQGVARLQIKVGSQYIRHDFVVTKNLKRNVILGRDWLKQNSVRMYFDLGAIRLGSEYIALQEEAYISSIVRLRHNVTLKPQHLHACTARAEMRNGQGLDYEVVQIDKGFLSDLSGVSVANTVVKIKGRKSFPLLIMNNTNQTVKLKKGYKIGRCRRTEVVMAISKPNKQKKSGNKSNLNGIKVPEEMRKVLNKVLQRNTDLFVTEDRYLGRTDTVEMRIDTGKNDPIKKNPYRTPLKQREEVNVALEEMLQAGVIERSNSPWSFPIVLVKKKDGTKRFCVDFRALNKITKKYARALPVIDDILASLGSAKYFSKLDLKSGYWQVKLNEKDKEKTAFTCHRGLFQFNVMPFGLANAPGVFQELMSVVLQGQEEFAVPYLDDILIFSKTKEEHVRHIEKVLGSLRRHNLRLKAAKCEFFGKEVQYLGFRVSEKGIQPEGDKVKAIQAIATPTTVKQVRSFIGMTSYYRRFIKDFSVIAEPLIRLTRKHARFCWDDACQSAFNRLKSKLAEMVMLAYPDTNKGYRLYTDASDYAIGATLSQMVYDPEEGREIEKPIYFLSHKLSDTQTRWSTIEKEAYAIHYALNKLNHYLHSATFTIYTDHRPLEYLLKSPIQNRKIQTWALSMAGYDCTIQYLKGKDNVCADLLSRAVNASRDEDDPPVEIDDRNYTVSAINSNRFEPREFVSHKDDEGSPVVSERPTLSGLDMCKEQDADSQIVELKKRMRSGKTSKMEEKKYIIMDDIVYYLSTPDDDPVIRLYIPSHLRMKVLKQYHDENGHMGVEKTFHSIKQKYFWPGLFKKVNEHIGKCVPCQTRNLRKQQPQMQETDMPSFPFAKIALDISGPYPRTLSGNQYIVTFIDMYSGWPEAFAVPNKKAETVVHLLIEEIFPRFGAPLQLLTDNGPENVNGIMKRALEELNVDHVTTSFYHPQSNGKIERFHRTMHDVLAKKIGDNDRSWDMYLNQMLAAVRFHVSETTKYSPYYLLYNRDVVLPLDNILRPRRIYYGEEDHEIALQDMHRTFTLVRNNVKRARKKMIDRANEKTKAVDFQVGDLVYYKNNRKKGKLDVRWSPYYVIIEKTGPVSYRIRSQLTGAVTKAHGEHLRKAELEEWDIPNKQEGCRKTTLSAPVEDSSSDQESSSGEEENYPQQSNRHQRESPSQENRVPLMERKIITRSMTAERAKEVDEIWKEDIYNLVPRSCRVDYDSRDQPTVARASTGVGNSGYNRTAGRERGTGCLDWLRKLLC